MNLKLSKLQYHSGAVIVPDMFIGSEQGVGKHIIDAQQVLNVKDMDVY